VLTSEIKQKINNARDILVGKIPTPTGQVEQITLALVYKFMNDIDEQNKDLGGKLKFFTGEYSKYAWKHLLDKSLSAYERVTAYGEGLEKMHLNPSLPQFFRNVFRGAFLPFRDPEVLTIFLKQIDEFRYGHNGDLGDAFEYLLQVMGTQVDAVQFLTPRHIINFIVSIVDPEKTDKILDPAVGTAGFLISAYQHLLKQNTLKGSNKPGSALTVDDRKRFANNFVGYDVSHDLVRLSLVNLYFHNFADPKIYEYDTLGNLARWDDDFDCILTNPPFMTPKGGVKPHKRFSIQAKKSEVLFVDYIMEHLNPNGKSGIIVPEGIIFQSATAYKTLRKMMIDQNFLYAVVSLPAGIFQPYSGVKTSVLLMDRVLAKKTKDILFVKVENDGFDLGAQRRPIDKNDLIQAAEILKRYKTSIQTGKPFELSDEDKQIASLIPIEKISKSDDYNLSGDRYKETIALVNQNWPVVELGKIFLEIKNGRNVEQIDDKGKYRVSRIQTISNWVVDLSKTKWTNDNVSDEDFLREGDILLSHINSMDHLAKSALVSNINEKVVHGINLLRLRPNKDILNPHYASFVFQDDHFINKARSFAQKAVNQASIKSSDIRSLTIPFPPLEVQQEIVSQLDSYQKIIDGAKQVVDNYKPEIKIDPNWPMMRLTEVCDINSESNDPKDLFGNNEFVYIDITSVENGTGEVKLSNIILPKEAPSRARRMVKNGDVLLSTVRPNLKAFAYLTNLPVRVIASTGFSVLRSKKIVDSKFLYISILDDQAINQMVKSMGKGAYPSINTSDVENIKIPLPPFDTQK
jgi:type I restriction enzyme M protein